MMPDKKNNIVIDIETLATTPDAVIVSIGAVKLKPIHEHTLGDTPFSDFFYQKVDIQSCLERGMSVEAGTIEWWMQQSDESREVFEDKGIPISSALNDLSEWVGNDAFVWGNGSDFDNTIIRNAYKMCNLDCPWHYRNNRCYRTLASENPHIKYKHEGIFHHALHDAKSEARHLFKILNS